MRPAPRCPVCTGSDIEQFFTLRDVPMLCNVLHSTRDSALAAPRGTIELGYCTECSHIYNYAFDNGLMHYSQTYENSLHYSPRFHQYAEELARRLIERYAIRSKHVIEIGCGKGDFLKLICELGDNRATGFDTSFQPELIEKDERITVFRDFFSERYTHLQADFLICRHVLEHIEAPRDFLSELSHWLRSEKLLGGYFEVPNALWTLRDQGVWDLIYEHCSYFTPDSLLRLFSSCGFEIISLEEQFGGQFLGIEIKPVFTPGNLQPDITREQLVPLIQSFSEHYRCKVEEWKTRFQELDGQRLVVWGSGSKGVTFLNTLKPSIEYVVDINPRKQGRFVAGTGQQIVSPEFLAAYKPDAIIIMNPLYKGEIEEAIARLTVAASLIDA